MNTMNWLDVNFNEQRLSISFIDVVVAFNPIQEGYQFRIGSSWSSSKYDTIDDAKRVAISSLRNKLHATLDELNKSAVS